jgi:hypothetical protein
MENSLFTRFNEEKHDKNKQHKISDTDAGGKSRRVYSEEI